MTIDAAEWHDLAIADSGLPSDVKRFLLEDWGKDITLGELAAKGDDEILRSPNIGSRSRRILRDYIAVARGDKCCCAICNGTRGGAPGNENIIRGIKMCDYCHADDIAARRASAAKS